MNPGTIIADQLRLLADEAEDLNRMTANIKGDQMIKNLYNVMRQISDLAEGS